MNGVDRIDQHIQHYPFVKKTVKWSKKCVIYLSMHNAFTLYKCEFPNGGTKNVYEFILSVIRSCVMPNSTDDLADNESDEDIQVSTPRAPFLDPATRVDSKPGKHVMVKIRGSEKKK